MTLEGADQDKDSELLCSDGSALRPENMSFHNVVAATSDHSVYRMLQISLSSAVKKEYGNR